MGDRLEHRGFDRQGLGPRRLDRVHRLTRLGQGAAAAIDRLGDLQIELVLIKGRDRWSSCRSLSKTAASAADLAGEVDGRTPARQRLRHLLVGRPQQGALRQELRVGVVRLGERLGHRLPDRRGRADREQAGNPARRGKGRDDRRCAAETSARGSRPRPVFRELAAPGMTALGLAIDPQS